MNVAMTVPQLLSTGAGAVLILVIDYRLLMIAAGVVLMACAASLLVSRLPDPPDAGDEVPAESSPAQVG